MTKRRVTIRDVAKAAGVSTTTVSRVLNGIPDCSKPVQDKIRKIAIEVGYRASYFARGMKGKSTNLLAMLMPSGAHLIRSAYFNEIWDAIDATFSERGFRIMSMMSSPKGSSYFNYREILREPLFDGMLVIAPESDDVAEIAENAGSVPLVIINGFLRGVELNFVDVDNVDGMKQAVKYLFKSGKKHIAYLGGPKTHLNEIERFKGYRLGLEECGLPIDEDYIIRPCHEGIETERAMTKLLALKRYPDGIVAFNDATAIDAMRHAKIAKKRVPQDIAFIGFDDTTQARIVDPPLTSVQPPYQEMAKLALKLIIEQLKNNDAPRGHHILPGKLILRDSTPPAK